MLCVEEEFERAFHSYYTELLRLKGDAPSFLYTMCGKKFESAFHSYYKELLRVQM
jgi:hypothetical protein